MKGLLSGGLPRDFKFEPKDGRAKYPMFQGEEWQRNQDLIDALRPIAAPTPSPRSGGEGWGEGAPFVSTGCAGGIGGTAGRTLSQLVINWTIHQPGITSAICGAKRADQARDNAGGMGWKLTDAQMAAIDAALKARGKPVTRAAV